MAEIEPAVETETPQEPQLVMRWAARSDVGMVRVKNDDSAYAGQHLAVVADGMGGHAGGNVASASTVLDLIHLDHSNYSGDAGTVLADEIQTANSILNQLVHMDPRLAGMGTTVTALLLSQNKLHFAHIGDSRAYRLRDGVFEQMSIDHTFVQRLVDEGRLRADEAESHPHKNVLMRVLGDVDASPELDLDVVDAREGDRWLLCSDGLNYVPHHMVEQVIRSTRDREKCAQQLIDLTLAAGSPDNVSVVVVDLLPTTSAGSVPESSFPHAGGDSGALAMAAQNVPEPGPAPDAEASVDGADEVETAAVPTLEHPDGSRGDIKTDPNLGAHLVAEVLRMELATRPHHLVGSAALAIETGNVPNIAGRAVARRAASVLTHRQSMADVEDFGATAPERTTRHWGRWVALLLGVAILVVAGWWGYAWTQTRYYVGEKDGRVAIYNGVAQQLGPIELSRLHSVTDIPLDSLPAFSQQRVRESIAASDLPDAEQIVQNLSLSPGGSPESCPSPSSTASPTPSAVASAKPGASPSAKPTGTAIQGPTPPAGAGGTPECPGGS